MEEIRRFKAWDGLSMEEKERKWERMKEKGMASQEGGRRSDFLFDF